MKTHLSFAALSLLALSAMPLSGCIATDADLDADINDAMNGDETFDESSEALSGKTYYVSPNGSGAGTSSGSPSSFSAIQAKVAPGDTVIALPGSYPNVVWKKSGSAGKPIRIKAKYAAVTVSGDEATVASASKLSHFAGTTLTLESVDDVEIIGFKASTAAHGIEIEDAHRVTLRANHLHENSATGILASGGDADDVIIESNYFTNRKRVEAGGLGSASTSFRMDYGVRLYHGGPFHLRKNLFNGLFNHAISLKERVSEARIAENTFIDCGRWCIELGQNVDTVPVNGHGTPTGARKEKTSGLAVIQHNSFVVESDDSFGLGISMLNISEAQILDNVFEGFKKVINVTAATDLGAVPKGSALTWADPRHPKSVVLARNLLVREGSDPVPQMDLGGRGRNGEKVTLDGNEGTVKCNIKPLIAAPSDRPNAIDKTARQTTAAPALVRKNGNTWCPAN